MRTVIFVTSVKTVFYVKTVLIVLIVSSASYVWTVKIVNIVLTVIIWKDSNTI